MTMPKGIVYLFNIHNKGESVMYVDYENEREFVEDLKRFFTDYEYDINNYIFALYVNDDFNQLYKVNVSRETLGL